MPLNVIVRASAAAARNMTLIRTQRRGCRNHTPGRPLATSAVMLKPRDIGAYRDLLVLFTRYGRKDFTINFESTELFIEDELSAHNIEPDVQQRAKAFAESLKKMGPTYVNFG